MNTYGLRRAMQEDPMTGDEENPQFSQAQCGWARTVQHSLSTLTRSIKTKRLVLEYIDLCFLRRGYYLLSWGAGLSPDIKQKETDPSR